MNIQKRIKSLQIQRNWSVNHMALEADLSPGTVLNWFNRNATPTIEGIEGICYAFGITVSEFFNEPGKQPTYLSDIQQEFLGEFNLLDPRGKDDILRLIKTRNEIRRKYPT